MFKDVAKASETDHSVAGGIAVEGLQAAIELLGTEVLPLVRKEF